jgi:hypothetical protein
MPPPRRFPPPWSIEERQESFIVKGRQRPADRLSLFRGGAAAADVDEAAVARRGISYRGEHRQATERAATDIEGHTTTAKFNQPGRLSARIGRQSAPIALWYRTTEGGSPQPGSAGLGVYQAGSLRSASRLSVNHAVQGCRPAHSTFRSSDVSTSAISRRTRRRASELARQLCPR